MRAFPGQLAPWAFRGEPDYRPRPWRTAAVYGALAVASLAIGYAAGLGFPAVLIAPVSLFLLGLIQTVLAWDDLVQRRRAADQWFRLRPVLLDSRYEWRAAELTSDRERGLLARSLRNLVAEVDGRAMPGPVPINVPAIRTSAPELSRLADRLADRARPVTPGGILAIHELLQSPGSPLYERSRSELLPLVLVELTRALEAR